MFMLRYFVKKYFKTYFEFKQNEEWIGRKKEDVSENDFWSLYSISTVYSIQYPPNIVPFGEIFQVTFCWNKWEKIIRILQHTTTFNLYNFWYIPYPACISYTSILN